MGKTKVLKPKWRRSEGRHFYELGDYGLGYVAKLCRKAYFANAAYGSTLAGGLAEAKAFVERHVKR